MAELAHAYVSIRASTGGMQGDVRKALTGIESQANKTGQSMGQKLSSGIASALKKTAVGVGVAGGAAIAAGLTKGIGRLSAIEQAEAKLSGLGNSAKDVEGIMTNALASVRGTAFGLEEAATVAAGMVAAGVKPGKELEGVLKTVGDTAAIAGVSMQDMGSIFGKVAATGKLQGDELMQLSDAGIPALALLSDHLGKTTEEVRKMVSDGKVGFDDFAAAMEAGMGGAALKMGDTTVGAFKNMMAASGRLGATLAGPFFEQAGGAFRGLTELIDNLDEKAGPVMDRFGFWLEGSAVPALAGLRESAAEAFNEFRNSDFAQDAIADLSNVAGSLAGSASQAWPALVKIAGALGDASQALGVSAWEAFVAALEVGAGVLGALVGPLNAVADVMEAQPALVAAAVAGWLAFKTIPSILGGVNGALDKVTDKLSPAQSGIVAFGRDMDEQRRYAEYFGQSLGTAGAALGALEARVPAVGKAAAAYRDVSSRASESASFHMAMARSVDSAAGAFHLAAAGASRVGGVLGGSVAAGASAAVSGVTGLVNALGGPLNVGIMAATTGFAALAAASQNAKAHQDALRQSSQRLAESQKAVAETLAQSNGEVSSEVWAELESQINSTRSSLDQVAATSMGFMDGMGVGIKSAQQLYAALKLQDQGMLESAASTFTNATAQHRAAKDAEAAAEAINNLGLSNELVAQKVYGSAAAWEGFRAQLLAQGEDGERAAAQLGDLRAEFERQQAALAALPDGAHATAEAIAVIGDEASSADQQLSALRSALQELGLIQTTAEQQAFQYAEAIDDIVDSAGEAVDASGGLGEAALLVDGKLNPAKENARALNDELSTLGDEFLNTALKSGDAAGAYEQAGPALEALATKYDLPIGKVRELAGQYGLLPDQVGTIITVANDEVARGQVQGVLNSLNAVKPGATAQVRINNQQAMDALRMTGVEIINYDAKSGTADVKVENSQALEGVNQAWGQVDGFDVKVGTADVRVDNSQAAQGVNEAKSWIDSIPFVKETKVIFRAIYEGFRDLVGGGEQHGGAWNGARSLKRFARGGHNGYRLPKSGPGTEVTDGFIAFNSDNVPAARLDAGEWIINRRSSDKYNRELAAINAGTFPKLPGYAKGGLSGAELDRRAREIEGAAYDFGGWNNGWVTDCTGAASILANLALVGEMFKLGRFATANAAQWLGAHGFKRRRWTEGSLGVGFTDNPGGPGGGHAASTLPHGTNVEMGGNRGNGQYGGNAAGANDPQFREQWSLPMFTWGFSRTEGLEGLMPPGHSSLTGQPGSAGTSGTKTGPGLYASPGNSGRIPDGQPATWSDMAAGAAAKLVGGQVSDALGIFGIPDQLPPIVQAWQMLNERPGDGPSDWELSTAAAEVTGLDASIELQERAIAEIAKALDAMKGSPFGDPLATQVAEAEINLERAIDKLNGDRAARESAKERLDALVEDRMLALADPAEDNSLAMEKLHNTVLDKEEALRKAKTSLSDAEAKTGKDRNEGKIVDAQGRVAKAERDLDMAKKRLAEAEAKAVEKMTGLSDAPGTGLLDEIRRDLKVSYDPAGGAEQWRPMVIAALKRNGFAATQREQDLMIAQIDHESSGNPSITQQIQDVNSGGNEAEGLLQVAKGTWRQHRDPELPDDWHDPWANMNAALRYYKSRYGMDLGQMWGKGHGYNAGGWISGHGTKDSVPLVGAPGEFIVNRKAAAQNREALEAMNAGRTVTPSGGGATYNIYTFSLDEAMSELSRKEAQHAQTFLGAR